MTGGRRILGVRTLVAITLLGVAFGAAAFAITSFHPQYRYLGPLCTAEDQWPGFDMWTGLPHGRSYIARCDPPLAGAPTPYRYVGPVPDEMAGRRAIPLPVGIPTGWLLATLGVIWSERRQRSSSPRARPNLMVERALIAAVAPSLLVLLLVVPITAYVGFAVAAAITYVFWDRLKRSLRLRGDWLLGGSAEAWVIWCSAVGTSTLAILFAGLPASLILGVSAAALLLLRAPLRTES